jgi:radical SAM protein with 4Fe4S-binding SPASM domain
MKTKEMKDVIRQLSEEGLFTLIFTGGEPLVRKDAVSIMNYALKKDFIVSINTNGTFIDKKMAKFLSQLWLVKVSIDSADKNKNDYFRGFKGCTNRALRGIKYLKMYNAKTAVQTTLSKFNINEVGSILDLTKSLGAIQYFSFFVPLGRGEKIRNYLISSDDLKKFFDYLKNRKDKEPKVYVHHPLSFLLEKENIVKFDAAACPLGNIGVSIEANGEVFPCPYLKIKLGNLKEKSFNEIWKNWKKSELYGKLMNKDNLKGKCSICKFKVYCNGGCRALTFYTKNDFYLPDPLCFIKPNK